MTEVTVGVLEEASKLGISKIWLQPGCEDSAVLEKAKALGLNQMIHSGPCVLVELGFSGEHWRQQQTNADAKKDAEGEAKGEVEEEGLTRASRL